MAASSNPVAGGSGAVAASATASGAGLLQIPPALKAGGGSPKASHKWRWIVLAVLILAVAAFVIAQPRKLTASTSQAALVTPSSELVTLTASGYLVAQRRASLASKASGRLVYLGVREGSRVKAGDLLARLDSRDVSAQLDASNANITLARGNLAQAQAELRDANSALERARELVAKNFASPATLDTATARQQRAQAAADSMQAALKASEFTASAAQAARDETSIYAPFDGVVVTKNANVGDVITPFNAAAESKGAVLTLADLGTLEAEVDVSESNLGKVSAGQPCEIVLDALPDERFAGQVVSIVPTVDRAKATVKVKVRFDALDPRFLPDMSVRVSFLSRAASDDERKPRLIVPKAAVQSGQVWKLDAENRAQPVSVKTGRQTDSSIEIMDGLAAGDTVLNPVPADIKPGTVIEKPARR